MLTFSAYVFCHSRYIYVQWSERPLKEQLGPSEKQHDWGLRKRARHDLAVISTSNNLAGYRGARLLSFLQSVNQKNIIWTYASRCGQSFPIIVRISAASSKGDLKAYISRISSQIVIVRLLSVPLVVLGLWTIALLPRKAFGPIHQAFLFTVPNITSLNNPSLVDVLFWLGGIQTWLWSSLWNKPIPYRL